MTKAELIRRIAKRSGVPDSETKIFFELFLQKAASILNRGEAVKLRGIGYFQLRQGIIKDVLNKAKGNIVYSDLMVYFPAQEETGAADDSLIFNVPLPVEAEYSEVDSYFSLSIGRPVIPLEGVIDSEYFIPPSGHELKKLIETKVDKLLREAEVIDKYIKGNEVLIIEADKSGMEQYEINWDESATAPKAGLKNKIKKENNLAAEFEHLTWDFGEDLSKQIEEEAIIDSANVTEQSPSYEKDKADEELEWDFGAPEADEIEPANSFETGREKNIDVVAKDFHDEFDIEERPQATVPEEKTEEDINRFERVKSITSEFGENDAEELRTGKNNLSWNFGETSELAADITEAGTPHEENSLSNELEEKTINLTQESVSEFATEEIGNAQTVPEIEPAGKKDSAPKKEQERKEKPDRITDVKTRQYSFSRNKSPFVFIIALFTIIAVGAALFIFLQKDSLKFPWQGTKTVSGQTPASTPVIIERQYDIQVTYPYNNEAVNNKEQAAVNSDVNAKAAQENQSAKSKEQAITSLSSILKNQGKNNLALTKKNQAPTLSTGNKNSGLTKVKDNVYKSGNNYFVQVSSWQSEFVAKKESEKFNRKGFKSFVEKVNIPGKGTWFRVKVGNFKSVEQAENFYNTNK